MPKWNVDKVTGMISMFRQAFNGDMPKWNVDKFIMYMCNMFSDAKSFNQDLSKWKVTQVADMETMFRERHLSSRCGVLRQKKNMEVESNCNFPSY